MTKLSLTILISLMAFVALPSYAEHPGEFQTAKPVLSSAPTFYQERLAREAYIKRQIDGRRTQSTFNPSGLRVGDVILDGFGQRSTRASVNVGTNRSRGPAKVREQSQSRYRIVRNSRRPTRRHHG